VLQHTACHAVTQQTEMSVVVELIELPQFVYRCIPGADTPLYLALLPQDVPSPRGAMVSERKIVQF